MKDLIIKNLDQAAQLEALYHQDKKAFKTAFDELYPAYSHHSLMEYWQIRLNYKTGVNYFQDRQTVMAIIWIALLGVFIVKIPDIFNVDNEFFFPRNIGFVVFLPISLFFAWKYKASAMRLGLIGLLYAASAVYINLLPVNNQSDTFALACMHLVVVLWSSMAFIYGDRLLSLWDKRMEFLKFNGDLIVMTALLVLAGAILSGITIGLFSVIGFSIERFYFEHLAPVGLALIPLLASFLIQVNPQLVDKISPLIARIFSPVVLVMLFTYLIAISFSEKNLYTDRDFLLIFNLLLIGVMAIIFFSLSESYKQGTSKAQLWILFLLAVLTIIVNSFALSAIVFRIDQYGFTPNRLAVLGSNCLMLINLLLLAWKMLQGLRGNTARQGIALVVAQFVPLYFAWAVLVLYVFPILFQYK